MQTMNSRFNPTNSGLAAFDFAGFHWPRYVAVLPQGSQAKRLARYKNPVTGPYYHAPKPVGANHGRGFYLDNHGMPGLRWQWCDKVEDTTINHTGWFTDPDCIGEKIRGVVFTLPKGRGFLAGWSMGESMASELDCHVYETAAEAAYAADSEAEDAAERECAYQEEQRALEAEGEDE